MAQTLRQIQALLSAYGLRPRRAWGQNFLHDHNKLRVILDAADLGPGRTVLEVGPGTGTLTGEMLQAGARVVAVEIDPGLCRLLRDRFGPDSPHWQLLPGDVLAGKHALNPSVMQALGLDRGGQGRPFQLIANLPYQVASPLLVNLAVDCPAMTAAIVMVQREVARRITATTGKDYGPLSVILQAACRIRTLTTLPPSCFWPSPKVESAVLHLQRRRHPLADDLHRLADFTTGLFSARRKQVGTILGRAGPWPAGIDPTDRPEQLSIEQLVALMQRHDRPDDLHDGPT